jgi:hypothetical protein
MARYSFYPQKEIAMTWVIERLLRLKLTASIGEELAVTREQTIAELRAFLEEIAEPVEC